MGELHRIRHDPLLVQRLIPLLYENGVRLLGFEFVHTEDQDDVDRLVSAASNDEDLAIDILRRPGGIWPYQEYLDVFKAAWSLNSHLHPDAERFKLVGLAPSVDYAKLRFGSAEEQAEQRHRGSRGDSVYAAVIEREALSRGMKMLVYVGRHHAFSRFAQPGWDENYEFTGSYAERRAGQRLRTEYPGQIVTVMLHAPFWSPAYRTWVLPFGGVLDRVNAVNRKPVGFDIAGSPFSTLVDSASVYALSYGQITLDDYCDGYVILDYVGNYRVASVVSGWFDRMSFKEFKWRLPWELPFFIFHPRVFLWLMEDDARKMADRWHGLARQLESPVAGTP
ncbi:MAG: hypothetical protein JSV86_14760 [Gemmatimonadota bacterium]|nr:MAG: hypothetical protein JSV86_14760 [Gemmatimonadota bacterium]